MKKHYYYNIAIAFIICLLYICFTGCYSFPWCDELYFSSPAANLINGGKWYTEGIGNPYPPFYSLLLAIWFLIFGVSHISAVALEVILAFIVYIVLCRFIDKRGLFNNQLSYYFLLPLYWLGFYMPTVFTMGRVDVLVILLIVVLLNEIIPINKTIDIHGWRLLVVSFLLAFSAIYPLPLVAFVLFYLYLFKGKEFRNKYFRIGLIVICGFALGLIATVAFAYYNDYLAGFLSWLGIGKSNSHTMLERLTHAYSDIPTLFIFIVTVLLLTIRKQSHISKSLLFFVAFIPALMMVVGRFERYYWWMMYIPTIILFVLSVEQQSKIKSFVLLTIVSIICVTSQLFLCQYPQRYSFDYFSIDYNKTSDSFQNEQELAKQMVDDNQELLKEYTNGVFVSELFYYPLMNCNSQCWYIFNGKFPKTIKSAFVSHDTSKFYWRIYEDFIRGEAREEFPSIGVFFSLDNKQTEECITFLQRESYSYEEYNVESHPVAKIITFKK